MTIADNIKRVRETIEAACARRGIPAQGVTLVAVSKTVEAERLKLALACGIDHLGENYLQEAKAKIALGLKATWHFIGHLQSNKVNAALDLFEVIQSVDRPELLHKIAVRAQTLNRPARILVQINLVGEAAKGGLAPQRLEPLLAEASNYSHLRVSGLMAIPPLGLEPAASRAYYRGMFALKEQMNRLNYPVWEDTWLSLGMSDDYAIAIEEGANMVRVGSAIFGPRS